MFEQEIEMEKQQSSGVREPVAHGNPTLATISSFENAPL